MIGDIRRVKNENRYNTCVLVFTLNRRVASLLSKTLPITMLQVIAPVNVIEANVRDDVDVIGACSPDTDDVVAYPDNNVLTSSLV